MKIFVLMLSLFSSITWSSSDYFSDNVQLRVQDDTELEEILYDVFDSDSASDIFDKVQNTKIELALVNDFNFTDPNSNDLSKLNDDLGRTHGFAFAITRVLDSLEEYGEYLITLSYRSEIFTNSTDPVAFQEDYRQMVYRNENNVVTADQYFKEENLLQVIISKAIQKNAYYWKVGLGLHEINADDIDRSSLYSALTQQQAHHTNLNEWGDRPRYRVYNNLAQHNVSTMGVNIYGEFGYDYTFNETINSRLFTRVGMMSRLTTIEDASYIGGYSSLVFDYDISDSYFPALRLSGGANIKQFSTGHYSEAYLSSGLHGKYVGLTLKFSKPLTRDPHYLNALPVDFQDREALIPPNETLVHLMLEGKIR
jgi:hypothetical protein